MFKVGERVVVNTNGQRGTVCGHGFFQDDFHATMSPAYMIRLDKGVWTRDGNSFINVIVVHPDNVEEVNDE